MDDDPWIRIQTDLGRLQDAVDNDARLGHDVDDTVSILELLRLIVAIQAQQQKTGEFEAKLER